MCEPLEEVFGAWELFEEVWERLVATGKVDPQQRISDAASREAIFKEMPSTTEVYRKLKMSLDMKDNVKAAKARAMGNALFQRTVKRYVEAVKMYNESIVFSEKGSEERALAYANRSAVCYELHQYQECLDNIRLARESNYPARLAEKLNKRENAAQKALAEHSNESKPPEQGATKFTELSLSYASNELVPQTVNCLELKTSEECGRFVATTKDLKAGDVVVIEKPFCTLLLDVYRYIRCDFCYLESPLTLIPCESCTVAMYCSPECGKKAFQQYHRYECSIIRDMWRIFTKIPLMALRTVTCAIAAFDHDLHALQKHLERLDESAVNGFTMDWTEATPRDVYETVHTLVTNYDTRDDKDCAHRVFFSRIIVDLLITQTELGVACAEDETMSALLTQLLLKHLQTTPMNMHAQYYMDYVPKDGIYDILTHASACYPLLSMLNHSCAPNLTRVTLRDGRCAVVITRPIRKGGQLYDNYGKHHCLHPIATRRSRMLSQYRFVCRCEACKNDYPLFQYLPRIDPSQYGLIDTAEIHAQLVLHQPKTAAELLPKLSRYLNDVGYQYPSFEVASCQELFLRCFEIIYMHTSDSAKYWKYCNP